MRDSANYDEVIANEIDANADGLEIDDPKKWPRKKQPSVNLDEVSTDPVLFAGANGGSLCDMHFIRMKIKTMAIREIEDDLIKNLQSNGLALHASLPLPDIYLN